MRSPSRIALFLGVVVVFLYIANVVVYEALALAFQLTATPQLVALGIVLSILPACFIGMMIVGSYYYNWFTRTAYTLLAVWMGTFGNLFFASVLYGLFASFAPEVGLWLFAAALVVSVYGVWHAKQIKAAMYTVTLPNLPAAWKNKKAVFISDLHLGQLHGPTFAAKVARTVMAEMPDIIFIGGDLYDGTQAPDSLMLVKPLQNLAAPWGVYYITGNHEEFGDATVFIKAIKSLGIRVLFDEKIDLHGLQLIGVDYHNANDAGRFANILSALTIDPAKPSLLLKHEPSNLKIAAEAGVSLQISGHTHYGQQWPFGLLAQLSYQGYAYGLKSYGKMHMLTSSGIGTWGPPVRIGSNSEMVVLTFD